jgi:hypothetical protein
MGAHSKNSPQFRAIESLKLQLAQLTCALQRTPAHIQTKTQWITCLLSAIQCQG